MLTSKPYLKRHGENEPKNWLWKMRKVTYSLC